MSRNLRNRAHPAPNAVSTYTLAPDFYNDPAWEDRSYLADNWKQFKAALPYKEGDTVWLEHFNRDGSKSARKAFISDVYRETGNDGWPRPKYRVHVATARGDRFANNFIYTWSGYIQRGYQLAAKEVL